VKALVLVGVLALGLGFFVGRASVGSEPAEECPVAVAADCPEVSPGALARAPERSEASPPEAKARSAPPTPPILRDDETKPTTPDDGVPSVGEQADPDPAPDRDLAPAAPLEPSPERPIPFPEALAREYTQDGLHEAFNDSFATLGMPGEVTSIDCSEYPCIVHGTIPVESIEQRVRFDKLLQQLQGRYRDASFYGSQTTAVRRESDPPGPDTQHFALSFYPKPDAALQKAMNVRMRDRKNEYMDQARQE